METEWWAIRYQPGPRAGWLGPTLVNIEGNTVYWDGGPTRMTVDNWDNVEFVKQYENNYEGDTNEWWDRVEEIRDQFELDFPPKAETIVSAGWLAPDGKFYPCSYMEHMEYARRLAWVHYRSRDEERKLEAEGWAKVFTDGLVMLPDYDDKYTQAQLDTLGDLFVLAKENDRDSYAANMGREVGNSTTD
ncbi:MAG: hypothetical protein ACXABY_07035 [Candidatus Thorarchaeota archaeon]|jgi:hypothetical protein